MNNTSHESQADFHWEKNLKNPITKKMSFSSSTYIKFTIWELFLKFKACKSVDIDAIGIEVAQQIKFSGCPTTSHFTVENAYLPLLTVKWPFVREPDNFILHFGWFLQSLEKGFIQTNVHMFIYYVPTTRYQDNFY